MDYAPIRNYDHLSNGSRPWNEPLRGGFATTEFIGPARDEGTRCHRFVADATRIADSLAHPLARRIQCAHGGYLCRRHLGRRATAEVGPQRAALDARLRPAAGVAGKPNRPPAKPHSPLFYPAQR